MLLLRLAVFCDKAAICEFSTNGSDGSRCVNSLFKLIAGKRPLEFRFPEAASRQCVLPTHNRPSSQCKGYDWSQVWNGHSRGLPAGKLSADHQPTTRIVIDDLTRRPEDANCSRAEIGKPPRIRCETRNGSGNPAEA
jgi:hypothetical protein